jgi:hypothetical protein
MEYRTSSTFLLCVCVCSYTWCDQMTSLVWLYYIIVSKLCMTDMCVSIPTHTHSSWYTYVHIHGHWPSTMCLHTLHTNWHIHQGLGLVYIHMGIPAILHHCFREIIPALCLFLVTDRTVCDGCTSLVKQLQWRFIDKVKNWVRLT